MKGSMSKAQKKRNQAHRQRMEEKKRQHLNWAEIRKRTVPFPDRTSALSALLPWIQRQEVLFSEFQVFLEDADILTFNTDPGDDTAQRFPQKEEWLRITEGDNVESIQGFVDLSEPEDKFSRVSVLCTNQDGKGNLLQLDFPLSQESLGAQERAALAFLEESAQASRAPEPTA